CPSPPLPSLRRRRRCPCVGGDCPLWPAATLPRVDHPYWRQGWPRARTPYGLVAAGRAHGWPPLAGSQAMVGRSYRGLAVASHL
ncbi:hypothetical protein GW17_00060438, partial [Ensete ventricosum]